MELKYHRARYWTLCYFNSVSMICGSLGFIRYPCLHMIPLSISHHRAWLSHNWSYKMILNQYLCGWNKITYLFMLSNRRQCLWVILSNYVMNHFYRYIWMVSDWRRITYLWVVTDSNINMNQHLQNLCDRLLYKLSIFAKARHMFDFSTSRLLYMSIVLPLFDYCNFHIVAN